jgi:hypothetical protein
MKWKEIIVGALVTLLVTILGGVLVYYFTKEPEIKHEERLTYTINPGSTFNGGKEKLSLTSIQIRNDGGIAANKIIFKAAFNHAEIKDFSVQSETGNTPSTQNINQNTLYLAFPSLLPSENVVINVLASTEDTPTVTFRSDKTFGEIKKISISKKQKYIEINNFVGYIIPFLGIIYPLAAIILLRFPFVRRMVFRILRQFISKPSKNNFAFLLLHQGIIDDATNILKSSLATGHDGAYCLSNLALCKALKRDFSYAEKLIKAAYVYSYSEREAGVVTFNEALILLLKGKKDEFYSKLEKAIDMVSDVKHYCDFSVHLDKVRKEPRFINLIK